MIGHTPAPWVVDIYGDVQANGEDVARIATSDGHATADARLISAAPELLEALKEIIMHVVSATLEHCDGNKCREQWCIGCFGEESANAYVETAIKAYSKAIAAIAKATGETP